MTKFKLKQSATVLNILIALVVTLVVNFSYLLSVMVEQRETSKQQKHPTERIKLFFVGKFRFIAVQRLDLFRIIFQKTFHCSCTLIVFHIKHHMHDIFCPGILDKRLASKHKQR